MTDSTQMNTDELKVFVLEHRITMTAERVWQNPNMVYGETPAQATPTAAQVRAERTLDHWKVTFRRGSKSFTTYYSDYNRRAPTADVVLEYLATDAANTVLATTFKVWANELGYSDNRAAERTYNLCVREADKLKQFLGAKLYQTLLHTTE